MGAGGVSSGVSGCEGSWGRSDAKTNFAPKSGLSISQSITSPMKTAFEFASKRFPI